jgi:lysophospholipase L1-like esterase
MTTFPPPSKSLKLVGLGSSFAAGPGLKPIVNQQAGRSGVNYINLLGRYLSEPSSGLATTKVGVEVTDLSISGATLLTILSEPQIANGVTFSPQLDSLPDDADIVTLTGGGNDLGYIGGLMMAALPQTPYVGWLLSLIARLSGRVPPSDPRPSAEEVTNRFTSLIDAIHQRAPKARIILITYLTCLGDDVDISSGLLAKDQIEEGRRVAEVLRGCYVEAQRRRGDICELVDVIEESKAHGIGSKEPWMAGWELGMLWSGQAAFHPTYKGHEYIAKRLKEVIERGT